MWRPYRNGELYDSRLLAPGRPANSEQLSTGDSLMHVSSCDSALFSTPSGWSTNRKLSNTAGLKFVIAARNWPQRVQRLVNRSFRDCFKQKTRLLAARIGFWQGTT